VIKVNTKRILHPCHGGSPWSWALALVGGALAEVASIHAATLLPSAYRVQAAALFAIGDAAQARAALAEGLRQSSSPNVAHERGFLLAVARE
jgi:hypothetical protein